MYFDHSTCMHYDLSTCMYYDHSTCIMSHRLMFGPIQVGVRGTKLPWKAGGFGAARPPNGAPR